MSRILYLAHRIPYPPNRGDRIRSFHWLKYLSERAEVHLAFLAQDPVADDSLAALQGICARVAYARLHRTSRWATGAWSLLTGKTATEGLFRSRELRRIVTQWSSDHRYDAVIAFCSSMAQYLSVPGLAGVPAVVDLVDVDSQKFFDYARNARGPRGWLYRLEGQRLRRLECEIADRVDAVTLVSQAEVDVFRKFCPAERVFAISNGVDLDYFSNRSTTDDRLDAIAASPSCVFVGALDYKANLDGVAWFCEQVWPRVLKQFPRAVFRIVGSRPGREAQRLGSLPGVELVGEVPDVRPYLCGATVVIAPLQVARGIQNKVLEAMAMGKAIVATPQACEGIEATAGEHLIAAASAVEWERAIGSLLQDSQERELIGQSARNLVEQQYAWSSRVSDIADLPGLEHCSSKNFSARDRLSQHVT